MKEREDGYDPACIEVLRGMEPVRKRPKWHVQDDGPLPSAETETGNAWSEPATDAPGEA